MIVFVLSHNRSHFEHYCVQLQWMCSSDKIMIINPLTVEALQQCKPDLIIKLPEWWLDKSQKYHDYLTWLEKSMARLTP